MPVEFRAIKDTHIKALISDWGLSDDELIFLPAGSVIRANVIYETNGFYYVEIIDHMPGNWRKLWYLAIGHWKRPQEDEHLAESATLAKLPAVWPEAEESSQLEAVSVETKVLGHVDYFGEESISGWAYYVGNLDESVSLEFCFDAIVVGSIEANDYRPDLERGGHGHGRHGFRFRPPVGSFSKANEITVRASNGQIIGSLVR